MEYLKNALRILIFIGSHPITKNKKLSAYIRFLRWQLGSKLLKQPVLWPFVDDTRLLAKRGMNGATGMIYVGLVELSEMALVLHYLRNTDVFVDVGANIGTYTVLASGVVGAKSIAIEPAPKTFAYLMDNLVINRITNKVQAENVAIGSRTGTIRFTAAHDTTNHALANEESDSEVIVVPAESLDSIPRTERASVLKIDVEGFEMEVVKGAKQILSNATLKIVVMELRGHGNRYGFDERAIHKEMLDRGFQSCEYDPFARLLIPRTEDSLGDMIYVRDIVSVRDRIATAKKFRLNTGDEI